MKEERQEGGKENKCKAIGDFDYLKANVIGLHEGGGVGSAVRGVCIVTDQINCLKLSMTAGSSA